jgi:Ca-activated chloride channel homolog
MSIEWVHPWALVLLLLPVLYGVWEWRAARTALPLPRAGALRGERRQQRLWRALGHLPDALRVLAVAVLVVAIARPRLAEAVVEERAEGVPIAIAFDISSSMLAEDFAPDNRLEVARAATRAFIEARGGDPMALVAFAGEAITMVPLTSDRRVLGAALNNLQIGLLEDGTAIGMGLATAASRLEHVDGESKVVILLSDGENNRGEIEPLEAATAAAALGIRVFTIGVGTDEAAPVPLWRGPDGEVVQFAEAPVGIDEAMLREIARMTGGEYFRADNPRALDEIYRELDRMVAAPVEIRRVVSYREWYLPLLVLGTMVFTGEWLLRGSRWGRVP